MEKIGVGKMISLGQLITYIQEKYRPLSNPQS